MNVAFPYRFDTSGHTASSPDANHLREMIYQVLFTAPGERVNRPNFGSGLMQLVFAPNSDTLTAATQFVVRGALHQWLGDLIEVQDIAIVAVESTIQVTVAYTDRKSQESAVVEFSNVGAPL